MIASPKRWRKIAVTVTALAATAVLVGAGPTTAATTAATVSPAHTARCISFDYVEPTTISASNVPLSSIPDPSIGTQITFFDHINDWAGNQVGSSTATVDVVGTDKATGDLMEEFAETMNFPDGALFSGGLYKRPSILAGDWVSAPITGVAGIYLGYSGTFSWRVIDFSAPYPAEDKVNVCRH
jgi:Allene oxide cyclase barrel like domain